MHIAVIIVGFRNAEDIEHCLLALADSTHEDFEIVICENGGEAAYEALRQHIPQPLASGQSVRIIQAPDNLGYAGGVNVGITASPSAAAWWILNPDTTPSPEALECLVQRLAQGDCDAAGGTLYLPSGNVQSDGGIWRPLMARPESISSGRSLTSAIDAKAVESRLNYLSGASMLVSRRFVEIAGLMREDYFLYCEEVEWCIRAQTRGLKLGFAPGALVLHAQGTTTGCSSDMRSRPKLPVFLDERNKILLTRDHFRSRLVPAAALSLLLMIIRFGRRGALRQLGFGFQGWVAGLRNQRGPMRPATSATVVPLHESDAI